jgi:hypothetical protein
VRSIARSRLRIRNIIAHLAVDSLRWSVKATLADCLRPNRDRAGAERARFQQA